MTGGAKVSILDADPLRVRIARAGRKADRQNALEFGEPGRAEVEVRPGGAFLQMLGRPRAGNGDDVRGFGEDPGDRESGRRDVPGMSQRKKGLEPVPVPAPIQPPEARVGVAEVLGLEGFDVLQPPGESAARDRREGDQQRVRLGAGLNEPEFGVAGPERIFRLNRGDRVNGVGAPQRVGGDLGSPIAPIVPASTRRPSSPTVSSIGMRSSTRCT